MISLERLEQYKDFVDPDNLGDPYDSRQGLNRLLGVLTPDPKGGVLAGMGENWYGSPNQLNNAIISWLENLGLDGSILPITRFSAWSYCEHKDQKSGEIVDGSLVKLGALVKKADHSSQVLYQRSGAGAELAVPLIRQAVLFVSKAREYAETRQLNGLIPHKFDSMWRILGSVNSSTDERRPLAVFDTIRFLVSNPGQQRWVDLVGTSQVSKGRATLILASLCNCGIIDYASPQKDIKGQAGRGWIAYTAVNPKTITMLDSDRILQDLESRKNFRLPGYLRSVIAYLKDNPDSEYEKGLLAEKLRIKTAGNVSTILTALADLGILERVNPWFKAGEAQTSASQNDLTRLFYDLICLPAEEVANTLHPLSEISWDKKQFAAYMQNYDEERSHIGPQSGGGTRSMLVNILPDNEARLKLSDIVDLFNQRMDREVKTETVRHHLNYLIQTNRIEQPERGYYKRVYPKA